MAEIKDLLKLIEKEYPDKTISELDVMAYLASEIGKLEARVKLLETYIGKY